jgi:hypothetical protein
MGARMKLLFVFDAAGKIKLAPVVKVVCSTKFPLQGLRHRPAP